jgi:hypothetical protein
MIRQEHKNFGQFDCLWARDSGRVGLRENSFRGGCSVRAERYRQFGDDRFAEVGAARELTEYEDRLSYGAVSPEIEI